MARTLPAEGWRPDPTGRHEKRWMSDGTPTALVRDAGREGRDPLPTSLPTAGPGATVPGRGSAAPGDAATPHWTRNAEMDIDHLPSEDLPHLKPRLAPTRGGFTTRISRPRAWAVGAVSAVALLVGASFVHGSSLPPDEVNGTVGDIVPVPHVQIAPGAQQDGIPTGSYQVQYSIPGSAKRYAIFVRTTSDSVQDGQGVVVHYDPGHPADATVASLSAPSQFSSESLRFDAVVALGLAVLGAALWSVRYLRLRYRRPTTS